MVASLSCAELGTAQPQLVYLFRWQRDEENFSLRVDPPFQFSNLDFGILKTKGPVLRQI